jgi:hypothetical protein
LATIPAPFIAPIASVVLFRKSRFVCAHALQALYENLVWKILLVVAATTSLVYSLTQLWHHYQTDWREFSLTAVLVRFAVGFMVLAVLALVNAVQCLIAASRAHRGVWPRNGRIVQAIVGRMHKEGGTGSGEVPDPMPPA